jgi:hypothetical protein
VIVLCSIHKGFSRYSLWKLTGNDFGITGKRCSDNREIRYVANGRCWLRADIPRSCRHVRFSNRPVGVKRFQTIHRHGVGVTRGLVLLYQYRPLASPYRATVDPTARSMRDRRAIACVCLAARSRKREYLCQIGTIWEIPG